jgi:hypothetical protein
MPAPAAENWIAPRMLVFPFVAGATVLYSAFRLRSWACTVLLGATWVGLVGAITWLAGAATGENVLSVTSLDGAIDRTVFFLVPAALAPPLTAACARLGMLSAEKPPAWHMTLLARCHRLEGIRAACVEGRVRSAAIRESKAHCIHSSEGGVS